MAIKVGDKLPDATFMVMTAEGPKPKTTAEVFNGRKVALFAVPGAYTPTCHKSHMPGFVARAEELKKKGFDAIAWFDKHVIDGAVNGVANVVGWASDRGRVVQTGYVRNYALGLAFGAILLAGLFLTKAVF